MALCNECQAPLNLVCNSCPDDEACQVHRTLCHVCIDMNRTILHSKYFCNLIRKDEDRKKDMGL